MCTVTCPQTHFLSTDYHRYNFLLDYHRFQFFFGTEIHSFFKVTVFGSALKFSTALRGYGLLAQVRGFLFH